MVFVLILIHLLISMHVPVSQIWTVAVFSLVQQIIQIVYFRF